MMMWVRTNFGRMSDSANSILPESTFYKVAAFVHCHLSGQDKRKEEDHYKQGAVAKVRMAQLCSQCSSNFNLAFYLLPESLSYYSHKICITILAYSFDLAFSDPIIDTIFTTFYSYRRPFSLDLLAFALSTKLGHSESFIRNL